MNDNHLKSIQKFKELNISLSELRKQIPPELFKRCDAPAIVTREDVKRLLDQVLKNNLSKQALLEWVNTVMFDEIFDYDEDSSDCIASIISELEEADERDGVLSDSNIRKYLDCLAKNVEL